MKTVILHFSIFTIFEKSVENILKIYDNSIENLKMSEYVCQPSYTDVFVGKTGNGLICIT